MFTGVPVDFSLLVPEGAKEVDKRGQGVFANNRRPKTAPRCSDIAVIVQED